MFMRYLTGRGEGKIGTCCVYNIMRYLTVGEEGARTDTAKCADKLSHRGCERSRHSHCSVSAASVYAALLPVRHPIHCVCHCVLQRGRSVLSVHLTGKVSLNISIPPCTIQYAIYAMKILSVHLSYSIQYAAHAQWTSLPLSTTV